MAGFFVKRADLAVELNPFNIRVVDEKDIASIGNSIPVLSFKISRTIKRVAASFANRFCILPNNSLMFFIDVFWA